MENIYGRIGKEIDLKELSLEICHKYEIGNYIQYEIIKNAGIDDLSYILYTDISKYIVKIMNHNKTIRDINQFIKKNQVIAKNNIKAPKVILNNGKYLYGTELDGLYINCCVIEYIDGKDLYTKGEKMLREDIDELISIIVPMHKMKEKLEIDYDEYCFMKIKEAYAKTKDKISSKLKDEVREFLKEYNKVNFSKLPLCFIHGDLISSNIMKDISGKLWLIDFYESGTGVRILDIVKILNSVIFLYYDKKGNKQLEKYFLDKYQEHLHLTEYELEVLPILRKADSYVGLMLGEYDLLTEEKEETRFWLKNDAEVIKKISIGFRNEIKEL